MFVIIPLGGSGERFKKNGYRYPKALIKVFGKHILYYLIESLNLSSIDFVYIPYNEEYSKYNFEQLLQKDFPKINFKFKKLENQTRGAAETLNIAIKDLSIKDCPVLCLDCDNFYTADIIGKWSGENVIFAFNDSTESKAFSFITIDEDAQVLDIIEKERVSNLACCGAYGFSSYKTLQKFTDHVLLNEITQKGEFYTSSVIRVMIKSSENKNKFTATTIEKEEYHCLGTPTHVKYFYNNFPKVSSVSNQEKMKKMRICFDLDNTLVTFPRVKDDYSTVMSIDKNIAFLKYLKRFGHEIIIYTARRMKTHKGCIGKVTADIGKITFDTLSKFNIPYDEIYFGKPVADVYIDDLALNCQDDIERELGFYMDTIDPRSFNSIECTVIETVTKKSSDLSGEIYYYTHIPQSVKDLFPVILKYDEINSSWFEVEKVKGLTLTNLFLSELLTETLLTHVMNTVERLQETKHENGSVDEIDIYANYAKKLKQRYSSFNYSEYDPNGVTFKSILHELQTYEKLRNGKEVVIHGDCVMTNILINSYEKVKFIDMRGKVGSQLSIKGDWLYDWAKLYQSLIGYDKVLMGKNINEAYEKKLLVHFEKEFLCKYTPYDFKNLKMITKSLLYSLLPLHNNEKCASYYKLILTF